VKKVTIIILILIGITAGGIFSKTHIKVASEPNHYRIPVVASFYPLAFFTTEIGGDKVAVTNLTPAGAEPHDYEPTTADVQKIAESKLIILNGAGLEPWAQKIENKNILITSDDLANKTIVENGEHIADPHVWLDPVLATSIATKIASSLEAISPENTPYFEAQKVNLIHKLTSLDGEYKIGLKNCRLHEVITSHAAFGYLASEYGFVQTAISGVSPDEEPTPQKLTQITNLVRQKHINYIFFETLLSPRLAETIAKETQAQTLVFNPLEGLTDEELQSGADYFSVQRNNLQSLRTALSCM